MCVSVSVCLLSYCFPPLPPMVILIYPIMPCSFQARIHGFMRQVAELLYQIKGPLNANARNSAEADADNVLRPLMEFLDAK